MAVGTQDHARDAERGGGSEEHSDVVDVPDRLADEECRIGVRIRRNHVVDAPAIETAAVAARDDAPVDRESRDRFQHRLRRHKALDRGVIVAGEDRFEPVPPGLAHEDPTNQLRHREHLLHHERLLADEDARSSIRTSTVAVLDVAEVFERRVVPVGHVADHAGIVLDTLNGVLLSPIGVIGHLPEGHGMDSTMDHQTPRDPEGSEPERTVIDDPTLPSLEDRRVAEMLEHSIDVSKIGPAIEAQAPPDAADSLEALDGAEAADVLEGMDLGPAAEALSHMVAPLAVSVIEDIVEEDPAFAAGLLAEMSADDATDLLQLAPDDVVRVLLHHMSGDARVVIEPLLAFDRRSAGGLMDPEVLKVAGDLTVREAIDIVRTTQASVDAQYLFVVDRSGILVGVLDLRRLVIAGAEDRVIDICERQVAAITPDIDQEEVAREFEKYEFRVLPVVDEDRHLLGVVTVDDVLTSIREEDTEDAQKMVGAGSEELVFSSISQKLGGRLPWLVVNLVTSALAAFVVLQFEGLIAEIAVLAVLMPVIANQSGNAGQQSLAVTLRGIVLDQVNSKIASRLLLREASVGLINGTIAGVLVGGIVAVLSASDGDGTWRLGAIIAASMMLSIAVGTTTGAALPILMRRCGADPATASTIFLTMVTDSVSFLIFLGTASLFADWLRIAG